MTETAIQRWYWSRRWRQWNRATGGHPDTWPTEAERRHLREQLRAPSRTEPK